MSLQLRYPNITGRTPEERQQQMERHVRSMIDQLNLFLKKTGETEINSQSGNFEEVLNSKISKVEKDFTTQLKNYWEKLYPVGAIYISVSSTSPATLFGGTWTQIKDTFLLAAGSTYSAGATGGEATHKLTESEMPKHRHAIDMYLSTWTDTAAVATNAVQYGSWTKDHVRTGASMNSGTYTGGGTAHNNMPPYLAVYVWKRTK